MDRFKKFISVIFNTRFIGILSTIYGVLSFIRDEFLPLDLAEKLRLGGLLNMIDWYCWVIFGVSLWAVSVAWESTKIHSRKESKSETKIEISGDSSQISTGVNSRNIQTGGGDYIEKLEISLSVQDSSFKQEAITNRPFPRRRNNVTPFLIGVLLDLSKSTFDSIYKLSEKDEDFFERLIKALNTLVNKSISYCEHPHSKDILPKFSLFFYGFGFGNALKGLDSFVRRLGLTSDVEIPTEPVRDLLKLAAVSDELPYTPNAIELNKYWKIYRSRILGQIIDMGYNDAPLVQSLKIARERFTTESKEKRYQSLLLVITNGKFTDGNYSDLIEVSNAIKKDGITLVIGFIGNNDMMPSRTLFVKENQKWNDQAKTLFQCSSVLDTSGKIGKAVSEMAIEKSWVTPAKAKLFLQVNQQEMLEELIDIITSPLRD
jgi:von Willebrand factor type A domain